MRKKLPDSEYAYHIPITAGTFAATLVIVLLIAIFTIGLQVFRIATSNPVKALRME